MPPKKKQKPNAKSSAAAAKEQDPELQDDQGSEALPHKNDKDKGKKGAKEKLKKRNVSQIPDDEYVCTTRPFFDYKAENRAQDDDDVEEEDDVFEKYREATNAEIKSNIVNQPAKDFPDRKWVMMWEAWKMFRDYERRAKYCNPDRFDMYITNDFEGYGFQELLENMVNAFEAALKKKDNLPQTWAIISAMGLWLNEVDQGPLLGNEDGDKTCALTRLLGYTLLRGLAAIDHADELKPDGKFLDVPLVITMWLEWSQDLPQYGIEDEAVDWRPHAAAYFTKAKYDDSKGIAGTKKLLDEIEEENDEDDDDEDPIPPKTEKDPWSWKEELKTFKSEHGIGGKIGGSKYDITKMSRTERASYAFDNVDPLKDVSAKALKEGLLDFE